MSRAGACDSIIWVPVSLDPSALPALSLAPAVMSHIGLLCIPSCLGEGIHMEGSDIHMEGSPAQDLSALTSQDLIAGNLTLPHVAYPQWLSGMLAHTSMIPYILQAYKITTMWVPLSSVASLRCSHSHLGNSCNCLGYKFFPYKVFSSSLLWSITFSVISPEGSLYCYTLAYTLCAPDGWSAAFHMLLLRPSANVKISPMTLIPCSATLQF